MNKKQYSEPYIESININSNDIIVTSDQVEISEELDDF